MFPYSINTYSIISNMIEYERKSNYKLSNFYIGYVRGGLKMVKSNSRSKNAPQMIKNTARNKIRRIQKTLKTAKGKAIEKS